MRVLTTRIPIYLAITISLLLIPNSSKAFDFAIADPAPAVQGQKIISDQISAFIEGDNVRAFSYTSLSIKLIFRTPARFIAMVKKGYPPLYKPNTFKFGKNVVIDRYLYQQVIATDNHGKMWDAIYALVLQSDGHWKITKVVIKPLNGESI